MDESSGMMRRWTTAAIVLVAGVAMLAWRLGDSPLAGTEGHRAITAHQMNQSGRYLVPTLYGYTYLKKPPLFYWILAGFEKIAGTANEWVWRSPSALSGALMAAMLAWWTGRRMGHRAGVVAGFASLGLVALWSQSRSADIDAANTLATVAAGLAILSANTADRAKMVTSPFSRASDVERANRPRGDGRRGGESAPTSAIRWKLVAGLFSSATVAVAFGAAMMLKGTACLPVVIGAVLGPALIERDWRRAVRPGVWVGLIAGAATLGVWAWLAHRAVAGGGLPVDAGGVAEARDRLMIHSWGQLGRALLLPLTVLGFGMPVALGIAVPWHRPLKQAMDAVESRLARSVSATVIVALAVCVISGMTNPRYAYPILPLLAVNVGIVASLWHRGKLSATDEKWLGIGMVAATATYTVLAATLLAMSADTMARWTAALGGGLLTMVGIGTIRLWVRGNSRAGGWGLAAGVVLAGMIFGSFNRERRGDRSGYEAGLELRSLVGEGATVTTWYTMWAQPEVFYYAGAEARPTPLGMVTDLPAGWVLFYENEWPMWRDDPHLSKVREIGIYKRRAYLAWWG